MPGPRPGMGGPPGGMPPQFMGGPPGQPGGGMPPQGGRPPFGGGPPQGAMGPGSMGPGSMGPGGSMGMNGPSPGMGMGQPQGGLGPGPNGMPQLNPGAGPPFGAMAPRPQAPQAFQPPAQPFGAPSMGTPQQQLPQQAQPSPAHRPVMGTPGPAQSPALGGQSPAITPAAAPAKPKPDWTEHTAPDGRKYYYNAVTKQSSWTKPAALGGPAEKPAAPAAAAAVASTDWKEFVSPDGRKYYYNKNTKESRWTMPDEMKAAQTAKASSSPAPVQVVKLEPAQQASTAAASTPPQANGLEHGETATSAEAAVKAETKAEPKAASPTAADLAAKAAAEPDDRKWMFASKEEAKDAFKELLASVNAASDWTWEHAMRLIISDARYSALKSLGEKKACFNEYLQQRKKDEKEEARVRAKQAREGFQTMLETSKDIKMSMRFSRARELFEDDPAWKAVADDREREELYTEFMKERDRKEREEKKKERRRRMTAFKELLEQTSGIKVSTPWRKASDKLEGDEVFEALDKIDRLEVWQDHIKDLEKKEKEEKDKLADEKRRKERKNRDRFKDMLRKHKDEGKLHFRSKWREYFEIIRKEECLLAVEKNTSGSRPKELFEDVLEEAEEEHEKTSTVLRDALKENNINITHTSTFEGFQAALEIASSDKVTDIREPNRRVFFEDLLSKAKEKQSKEEKRLKIVAEDFTDLLRSRHVRHDSVWDDVKSQIDHKERFKAVGTEEERVRLFDEYVARQKVKREKEKEREKEKDRERQKDKDRHKDKKEKRSKKDKRARSDDEDDHKSRSRRATSVDDGTDDPKSSKRHKKDKSRDGGKKSREKESDSEDDVPRKMDTEPEGSPEPARSEEEQEARQD
ncbi:hypothetical protein WJX84_007848 [Apatococcus fuscideae]|uniref:Uncharacterized protein n=1 Tax=Apatococcus fuscideae TaxID=2026836 RepID=A0AAW1SUA9_9CHLO